MVELITIMVIVGILAAVAAPRFFTQDVFSSRGFYDQAASAIRYAQKAAIAQRRFVCVTVAGGTTLTLTHGPTNACGNPLTNPDGSGNYVITAKAGVTAANVAFNFNALGVPSAPQSISVSGFALPIVVEAGTGYVH